MVLRDISSSSLSYECKKNYIVINCKPGSRGLCEVIIKSYMLACQNIQGIMTASQLRPNFPISSPASSIVERPRAASSWHDCGHGRVMDNFLEFTGGGESSASHL